MGTPPLISLKGLWGDDPKQQNWVCDQIGKAAREVGFLRITDHPIDLADIEATYAAAQRFFAMPDDFKQRYYIGNSTNHRGYVPFTEKGDYADEVNRCYEAFDMGLDLPATDPDYLAGNRLLGPNVWPELDGFKDTVAAYYGKVAALGRLICGCLERHLDLPEGAITGQMTKPISQLRLLHYVRQSAETEDRSVNMGAHTDYECLTLLHTRNEGLQVKTQDDEWIDVPADPSVFVINIGDMLEAWTNGAFRSTPHRVLNLKPERFSMPYFVAANYDTEIAPFKALVGPDAPARYDPFVAGEHLERMLHRDFPYLRKAGGQDSMGNGSPYGAGEKITNPFETRLNEGI